MNMEELNIIFDNYEQAIEADDCSIQEKNFVFSNNDEYSDYSYSDYSNGGD